MISFRPDIYISLIEKLRNVPRFSTHNVPKESVAEHSFYVAQLAMFIATHISIKVDVRKTILFALMHDVEEAITGDIISPVKRAIPNSIWQFANNAFFKYLGKVYPAVKDKGKRGKMYGLWRWAKHTIVEGRIVKYADLLAAMLFLSFNGRQESISLLLDVDCELANLLCNEPNSSIRELVTVMSNFLYQRTGV